MKQFLLKPMMLVAALAVLAISVPSCKGKVKDTDITSAIQAKASSMTEMAGLKIDEVKDGVVTISGECKDDACKALCETTIKALPGVKNVVNNCTIAPPPPPPAPPVVVSADDALSTGLKDVLKDFPGITPSVKDGIVSLTGEISKAKWMVVKQAIDKLTPKGYDLKGLKIK
jgi:hyperosmotically inducible periplasmic protein